MGSRTQSRPVRILDGGSFDDFKGFTLAFSRLLDDYSWRGNLDLFNEILLGWTGTVDTDWTLRWLDSAHSRKALGYGETVKRLERLLADGRSYSEQVNEDLILARRGVGPTLFDVIIEILESHGPGAHHGPYVVHLELF